MKKYLVQALGGVLILAAVLSNMGLKKKAKEKEETESLVLGSRLWSPPDEQEFIITEILRSFERQNNCSINFQIIDDRKLLQCSEGGVQKNHDLVPLDLIIAYTSTIKDWAGSGFLVDLTP